MRIGVVVPMALTADTGRLPGWAEMRTFAQHAESIGVRSLWVFDHFYDLAESSPTGPIHEAWTVQSALAAATSTVELGQLVTCSSFRHPRPGARIIGLDRRHDPARDGRQRLRRRGRVLRRSGR
jgi:alkanesulfonate monooxygenase SsuD/methylene tetrahydromethanopterin reductase-like flavin-dependent oxidoreductase (luciferase family)